jgi:spore coat protein H
LYGVPSDNGRLRWIPWDHDLALSTDSFPLYYETSANQRWPLLQFVLDDAVYRQRYTEYLREFVRKSFVLENVQTKLSAEYSLVAPYVSGPDGERPGFTSLRAPQDFALAHERLNDIVTLRSQQVTATLTGTAP